MLEQHNKLAEMLASPETFLAPQGDNLELKQKIQEMLDLVVNYKNNSISDGEYKLKLSVLQGYMEKQKFQKQRWVLQAIHNWKELGSNIKN